MHAPTLLAGAVFLAIGLACGATGANLLNAAEDERLLTEGQRTHAQVLHKSIRADRTRDVKLRPAYRVGYRYTPTRGAPVSGERELDAAVWTRVARDAGVEVVYLPSDPPVHRVEHERHDRAGATVLAIVGSFFALLGAWLARQAFTAPRPSRIADRLTAAFARSAAFTLGTGGVLFFLPFAVAGTAWLSAQHAEEHLFETRSVQTAGVVLDKTVVRKRSSIGTRPGAESIHYTVTYRYAGVAGDEIVGTSEISADTWYGMKERGPITLRVVTGEPWLHRLDGEAGGGPAPILLLALGSAGVIASAAALARGRQRWRRNGVHGRKRVLQ